MNERHCIGQNIKRVVVGGGHVQPVTITHAVALPVDVARHPHAALCGEPVSLPLFGGVPLGYSPTDSALCSACRRIVTGESSTSAKPDGGR